MEPVQVFASTFGRVLTVGTAAAALIVVVSIATSDGAGALWRLGAIPLLVTALVWAAFWYPRVQVSDGGVEVRNVLRTVHVPWPTFRSVQVRYSLVLRTTGDEVTAWAAPRSSGSAQRLHRPGSEPRTGGSSAETVAAAITARRAALASGGHLDDATEVAAAHGLRPTTTWNRTVLAVLGGLTLLAALGLATG